MKQAAADHWVAVSTVNEPEPEAVSSLVGGVMLSELAVTTEYQR